MTSLEFYTFVSKVKQENFPEKKELTPFEAGIILNQCIRELEEENNQEFVFGDKQ